MKKLMLLSVSAILILSSCVSKKEFTALEAKQKETQDLLNTATVKLNSCLSDKAAAMARLEGLQEQLADLRKTNQDLIALAQTGTGKTAAFGLPTIQQIDGKINHGVVLTRELFYFIIMIISIHKRFIFVIAYERMMKKNYPQYPKHLLAVDCIIFGFDSKGEAGRCSINC